MWNLCLCNWIKSVIKNIFSQKIINNNLIYLKTKLFENYTWIFYFIIDVYVSLAYSILQDYFDFIKKINVVKILRTLFSNANCNFTIFNLFYGVYSNMLVCINYHITFFNILYIMIFHNTFCYILSNFIKA